MKGYKHTLKETKKYLSKEKKVLELGCGTASTAVLLTNEVKDYTAVDISEKMIEIGYW